MGCLDMNNMSAYKILLLFRTSDHSTTQTCRYWNVLMNCCSLVCLQCQVWADPMTEHTKVTVGVTSPKKLCYEMPLSTYDWYEKQKQFAVTWHHASQKVKHCQFYNWKDEVSSLTHKSLIITKLFIIYKDKFSLKFKIVKHGNTNEVYIQINSVPKSSEYFLLQSR